MRHRIVLSAVALVIAACNRDKPDASASQQGKAPALDPNRPTAPITTPAASPNAAATKGATGNTGAKAPVPSAPAGSGSAAATELASARTVFTVQIASYLNPATAQEQKTRLERAGVPVWTTTATVGGQEFTRVRVGAATTAEDARAVARKIQATYHYPVWIATVDNRGVLPSDALTTTRAYAGGS